MAIGVEVEVDLSNPAAAIEACYERGWTDGLPVVPPTEELVEAMLAAGGVTPDTALGAIRERQRVVTAAKVAANAVMAGCRPEYFPVVLAATEAMLAPEFNLVGPSASLGGSAILVVVNGPIRQQIGLNARNNLFGAGNRANATIGRAIRLVLMNCCAAIPGLFDRSCFGHPGKFTYCIAENEEASPWTPLHVERGLQSGESAVTVFACEGPRQVRSRLGRTPEGVLAMVADTLRTLGTSMSVSGSVGDSETGLRQGEALVVIAGEHMNTIAAGGWGKSEIRRFLQREARRSLADLKRMLALAGEPEPGDEERMVPIVADPDDLMIVAAGGSEGPMSVVIPSWGPKVASSAVTRRVLGVGC